MWSLEEIQKSDAECRPNSYIQRAAKRASRKGPRQKTIVSRQFSTFFDNFCAGPKKVKSRQKVSKIYRHFSTVFARYQFSGPFLGAKISNWNITSPRAASEYEHGRHLSEVRIAAMMSRQVCEVYSAHARLLSLTTWQIGSRMLPQRKSGEITK